MTSTTESTTEFTIETPRPYCFASVTDHGWVALAPCSWDVETSTLRRVERLADGQVVLLGMGENNENSLRVEVESMGPLNAAQVAEIRAKVWHMLKLDEDLSGFYALAEGHATIGSMVRAGRGRLLRSPTLFEDVVKTICTTNITWSQTKAMVARLVDTLGTPYPANPTVRTFPTAQQVADANPVLFDKTIRMGYRNQYVQNLARSIVDDGFQLEALDDRSLEPAALRKALKSIQGVGDYAANTLMMIVGHYGHLAIDSEFRAQVKARYFDGAETISDREMAAVYADWGDWQYLAYWFDQDEAGM